MRQLRINLRNPFHTELDGPSDTTKMDNEKTDNELKTDRQTEHQMITISFQTELDGQTLQRWTKRRRTMN